MTKKMRMMGAFRIIELASIYTAVAGVSVVLGLAGSAAASAQSGASNAALVCMIRELDDGTDFHALLPANNKAALREFGFKPTPCGDQFGTDKKRQTYRDQVCAMAAIKNEDTQKYFNSTIGIQPNILCAMAESSVGRWKRGGGN